MIGAAQRRQRIGVTGRHPVDERRRQRGAPRNGQPRAQRGAKAHGFAAEGRLVRRLYERHEP